MRLLVPLHTTLSGPNIFHLLSLLALGSLVLESQLLEVHIGGIVDGTICSIIWALLAEEGCQVPAGHIRVRWESLGNLSDEACVGCRCSTKMGADLLADVLAGIEDGHALLVFAIQMNLTDIVFVLLVRFAVCVFGIVGLLLLTGHLDARELTLLKEFERVVVRVRAHSFGGPRLPHKFAIAFTADTDLVLELADFHLARVQIGAYLGADLVRVHVHGYAVHIDGVGVDRRRAIGLALLRCLGFVLCAGRVSCLDVHVAFGEWCHGGCGLDKVLR